MDTVARGGAAGLPPASSESARLLAVTRRVARLSVMLALLLEVGLLLVALVSGSYHSIGPFFEDAVQKIAWSFLLCAGLALILTVAAENVGVVMLAAAVAAPVASLVAHALLEAVHALAFSGSEPAGPAPYLIAVLRALEYAFLGGVVAALGIRSRLGVHHHALIGLGTGLLFGGVLLTMTTWPETLPFDSLVLVRWAINEVLFPTGCAMILYLVRE